MKNVVLGILAVLATACSGGGNDMPGETPDAMMPPQCVPITCEANQCGKLDDGCGGKLECGGCPSGQECGLAQPNQCGTPPPHCTDGYMDLGETGVDCGGDCTGCPTGGACNATPDCAAGNTCEDNVCLAGTWSTVAQLPTVRQHLSAVVGADGLIYTFGGIIEEGANSGKTGVVEVYNPTTNSWSTRTPMPTPRYGTAAVLASDGKIYVIGGQYNNATSPSTDGDSVKVEAYTPATDTWQTMPPLPNGRYYPAAAVGSEGAIYVTGGFTVNPIETLGSTAKFVPGSASWTTLTTPMTNARSGHVTVGASDGKIYSLAGYSGSTDLRTAEWMMPGTPGWNTIPPMMYPRKYAAATVSGNSIYVLGGNAPSSYIHNPVVEVYTPSTNAWTRASSLPAGRYGHAAVTLADGRIFVIGGQRAVIPPLAPNQSEQTELVEVLTP